MTDPYGEIFRVLDVVTGRLGYDLKPIVDRASAVNIITKEEIDRLIGPPHSDKGAFRFIRRVKERVRDDVGNLDKFIEILADYTHYDDQVEDLR